MDAYQVFVTWTCLSCNQYSKNQFLNGDMLMLWLYGGKAGESQNISSQNVIKLTN